MAEITLIEALLSLGDGRACLEIALRTVKPIRDIPVVVGDSTSVDRIVHPVVAVGHIHTIETIAADEIVVDNHVVATPSATPAPTSPATAPNRAHSHTHAKRDGTCCDDGAGRWRIVYGRIGIGRWSPHRNWVVLRNVDHLGTRRLDLYVGVTALRSRGYLLLPGRLQRAIALSSLAHALHSLHDFLLLRQEDVAKIRRPTDVLIQTFQQIGEHY